MQDRKFRCCSRPRIVFKLERKFVFYIVTAGLIEHLVESSKFTKGVSGHWRDLPKMTTRERPLARSSGVVGGVHRKSRGYRSATSANIPHDSDSERPVREVHCFSHLPKDRNCEVCNITKITRVLCRKHTGDAVLRAGKFSDLMTADHKVLSERSQSRNNHRYTVVVQDFEPLNGFNLIRVKNFSRSLRKVSRAD